MPQDELRLMVQISKLYYTEGLNQDEIAKRLFMSRPQISKMLAKAKRDNIVSIIINDPFSEEYRLADNLKQRYRLEEAVIIDTNSQCRQEALNTLAKNLSVTFSSRLCNGDTIGISAGNAIAACSRNTTIYNCKNLLFVPLLAGDSFQGEDWYANNNCARFAEKIEEKYMVLNTPLIIREENMRTQLEKNPAVKPVLDCYENFNVILLGIGETTTDSTLGRCNISKEEILWAYQRGAKAIIGASFIDAGGNEMLTEQSNIFIGIKIHQIRKCKNVIAVAMGLEKVEAIKSALKGGYIHVLCTNLETARKLL